MFYLGFAPLGGTGYGALRSGTKNSWIVQHDDRMLRH